MAIEVRSEKPDGIIVTWSKEMLTEGEFKDIAAFRKRFEQMNDNPDMVWYQKMSKKPQYKVEFVYIIISGKVEYRCTWSHYEKEGAKRIMKVNGIRDTVRWARACLIAPVVRAPREILMKGFQGFRYTHFLF